MKLEHVVSVVRGLEFYCSRKGHDVANGIGGVHRIVEETALRRLGEVARVNEYR